MAQLQNTSRIQRHKTTNKNTSPFRITFSSPACRDLEQLPRNQSTRPIANKDEEEDGSDERHPRPVMAMTVVDTVRKRKCLAASMDGKVGKIPKDMER